MKQLGDVSGSETWRYWPTLRLLFCFQCQAWIIVVGGKGIPKPTHDHFHSPYLDWEGGKPMADKSNSHPTPMNTCKGAEKIKTGEGSQVIWHQTEPKDKLVAACSNCFLQPERYTACCNHFCWSDIQSEKQQKSLCTDLISTPQKFIISRQVDTFNQTELKTVFKLLSS